MTRAERSRQKAQGWRKLVEEHAKSGQKDDEFCRERGVGVHSLRAWRYRLAREAALRRVRRASRRPRRLTATVGFVPVRVRQGEAAAVATPTPIVGSDSRSGVELVVARNRVVRVERGFDEETLARVLAILERR